MRWTAVLPLLLLLLSCKKGSDEVPVAEPQRPYAVDTVTRVDKAEAVLQKFSNTRFRNVTVENLAPGMFRIRGEAQIFEASFSWVVEDGHNELASGHQMTDAGAPEWGSFDFAVDVGKSRTNSILTLILFEISANDGARQHELPIPLSR